MIADAIASLFTRSQPATFRNATLENPAYSLNDPALYEVLAGGSKSASGVIVTHEGSLTLAAVYGKRHLCITLSKFKATMLLCIQIHSPERYV